MSLKTGYAAEQEARNYLLTQGLQWVESNYRSPWGEIDLIMRDKTDFVFVEVRVRSSQAFGGALSSVTHSKQRKLIKTTSHYLLTKKIQDKYPVRFDVLGFEGRELEIMWIKNAFGLDF
jgi:putative endonuclease